MLLNIAGSELPYPLIEHFEPDNLYEAVFFSNKIWDVSIGKAEGEIKRNFVVLKYIFSTIRPWTLGCLSRDILIEFIICVFHLTFYCVSFSLFSSLMCSQFLLGLQAPGEP
jgi:hypothetical protein